MSLFKKIFGQKKPVQETRVPSPNAGPPPPDFSSFSDPAQVSTLFGWIFNPNEEVATEAAETIDRLLKSKATLKNKFLYTTSKYIYLKEDHLNFFDRFDPTLRTTLACVATMNGNGHIRQAALRMLKDHVTQFSFPFILFRLNDWVPGIRTDAVELVRQTLNAVEPQFFIHHHKQIDWLLDVKRSNQQELHTAITDYIFSEQHLNTITSSISDLSDSSRLYVYKSLMARDQLTSSLVDAILSDRSAIIRLLAVRNPSLITDQAILERLLRDPNKKIRSYALRYIKDDPAPYQENLKKLVSDDSGHIRAIARNYLSSLEPVDFYQFYMNSLGAHPSFGNVLGLSETGSANDLPVLLPFLDAQSGKLRAAAHFAIAHLDYNQGKELAFQHLTDDIPKVKRVCAMIISQVHSTSDLDRLRKTYQQADNLTKKTILKIINQFGGWSIAGDFLIGVCENDTELRSMSITFLNSWYHYSLRLGTAKTEEDRAYVLGIYHSMDDKFNTYKIRKIMSELPFIFK